MLTLTAGRNNFENFSALQVLQQDEIQLRAQLRELAQQQEIMDLRDQLNYERTQGLQITRQPVASSSQKTQPIATSTAARTQPAASKATKLPSVRHAEAQRQRPSEKHMMSTETAVANRQPPLDYGIRAGAVRWSKLVFVDTSWLLAVGVSGVRALMTRSPAIWVFICHVVHDEIDMIRSRKHHAQQDKARQVP